MGSTQDWFHTLDRAWHYAQYLRRTYNVQHLLLGPPTIQTNISHDLASRLNQNLWNVGHGVKYDGRYDEGSVERYKEGSTVFVQRVKTAPEPNLFLGSQYHKFTTFTRQLRNFWDTSIQDKELFVRQFRQSLNETRIVLRAEPCLAYDFQVLVDNRGNLYHLDFERCFQRTSQDETELCTQVLNRVENRIVQQKRRLPERIIVSSPATGSS